MKFIPLIFGIKIELDEGIIFFKIRKFTTPEGNDYPTRKMFYNLIAVV